MAQNVPNIPTTIMNNKHKPCKHHNDQHITYHPEENHQNAQILHKHFSITVNFIQPTNALIINIQTELSNRYAQEGICTDKQIKTNIQLPMKEYFFCLSLSLYDLSVLNLNKEVYRPSKNRSRRLKFLNLLSIKSHENKG